MAAGTLFTVLANIPWGQVVDNAPKLADGASKLWRKVAKRQANPIEPTTHAASIDTEPSDLSALQAKVQDLEATSSSLQDQMQTSTELIKELAEQNTQLVQRIELNRLQTRRLAWMTGGLTIAFVATLIFFLKQA